MKQTIRILVAETGELMCVGISTMLKDQPDMVLLDVATTKEDIVFKCQEKPDLLLLAQSIPCPSLPALIEQLKESYPSVKILILTPCQDMLFVRATVKAGADGYVLSDRLMGDVLRAIRAVVSGEGWLSPSLGVKLLGVDKGQCKLTPKKLIILRLMAAGATNQQIATRMQIGKRTVSHHLSQIYNALEVKSRTEATYVASQMNLL